MPIIEVDHLTKEYRLGALKGLKDSLRNLGGRIRGKRGVDQEKFKALDDITFSIEQGEVVGIIGHNGAGKSTLLKMLARISTPTRGAVKTHGRIAPLIEVGAGFVPDFTGRENVYLNGAILGMSRKEIDRKFDEIVDFSEMSQFIDTPVKRYSSGMQVKLAFSVATSVESEILIVDEVLAVGDLAFQRKCFDRMEDIIRRQQRTVLLVSHNIRQVARLCTRAILLEHGRVSLDGKPDEVCTLFYQHANEQVAANRIASNLSKSLIDSSGEAELLGISVLDKNGEETEEIETCEELRVKIRFRTHENLSNVELIAGTHSTDFVYLTASSTRTHEDSVNLQAGDHEVEYILPYFPLVPAIYCIRFSIYDANKRAIFLGENLKSFRVHNSSLEINEPGSRSLQIPAAWRVDGQPFPRRDESQSFGESVFRAQHLA